MPFLNSANGLKTAGNLMGAPSFKGCSRFRQSGIYPSGKLENEIPEF